ncbi:MAG: alpha/beta hydrolase [Deltaproteobacteria bacterium]|nr:alpha/beta hydrolase [Nannocystaceae bacterium]
MIEITPVVFTSNGVPLAGRFYRDTTSLAQTRPTVIVTGSWLTVKEQMAHRYAEQLAARGFTAFTFDFAGFGESDGVPRQTEMPARKIADIIAAAAFVDTQSFVTRGGVGYLAICASAQYALAAIARGAAIRAFAAVAGWFHDAGSVAGFYGGEPGVQQRLAWSRRATLAWLADRELELAPAYAVGDEHAGMFFELPYYAEAERGAVPEWKNEMAVMSWQHWLAFDGLRAGDDVRVPTLLVHSDGCVFPDHVRQLHARLGTAARLAWIDSGTQIDFYDQPAQVDAALAAVTEHFRRELAE